MKIKTKSLKIDGFSDFITFCKVIFFALRLPFIIKKVSYKEMSQLIKNKKIIISDKKKYYKKIQSYAVFYEKIRKKILPGIPPKRCLVYSLILYKFLNEAGIKTTVHIGVRFSKSKSFQSHAWVNIPEINYYSKDIDKFKEVFIF
jgi:hypothetical protein